MKWRDRYPYAQTNSKAKQKSVFKAEHQRYGLDVWRREIRLYGMVMPDWKAKPEYRWQLGADTELDSTTGNNQLNITKFVLTWRRTLIHRL